MPMYCNLALFQWTLFSLHPREEVGSAWGRLNSTSGPFLCVSAPELARGKLRFEVFPSDRRLPRGGRAVALHFPGQSRTIWVKTSLRADGLAASWSPSASPIGSQAGDGLSELGWDGSVSEKQPRQSADAEMKRQKG